MEIISSFMVPLRKMIFSDIYFWSYDYIGSMGQRLGCEFWLRLPVSQTALSLGDHITQDKLLNLWASVPSSLKWD